jgi:hypothetical protein
MITLDALKLQTVIERAVRKALSSFIHFGSKPSLPAPESKNFVYGIPALADLLGCSYQTARKLKRNNHIPYVAVGHDTKFFLSDIIYAIDHDPVVSAVCTKKVSLNSKPTSVISVRVPRITIESDLYPGTLPILLIRYQGWSCYACVSSDLYHDTVLFHEFIRTIVLLQHKNHPFKIEPNFTDQLIMEN